MKKVPQAFNRISAAFQKGLGRVDSDPVEFVRRVIIANSKPEEWPELKDFVDYVLGVPYSEKEMEYLYYSNSPDYHINPIRGYFILLSKSLE